jgi:hypothetical protein
MSSQQIHHKEHYTIRFVVQNPERMHKKDKYYSENWLYIMV